MKSFFVFVVASILITQGMCDFYWSGWHDRDDPTATGDWEIYSLRKCNDGYNPINAECRVKGSYGYWYNANEVVMEPYRCTTLGFVCKNVDQPAYHPTTNRYPCKDYEIRFLCYKP